MLRLQALSRDFGIRTKGSVRNVNYTLTLGDIEVAVDWANTTGNGDNLTSTQIREYYVPAPPPPPPAPTHTHPERDALWTRQGNLDRAIFCCVLAS